VLLIIGIIAYCYFNDNYCCVNNDDEDTVGCLCCKHRRRDHYREGRVNMTSALYPDVVRGDIVDDPIFGVQRTAYDVPYMAHIDDVTHKNAPVIEVKNMY